MVVNVLFVEWEKIALASSQESEHEQLTTGWQEQT
jgi:hypothetical protein